MARIWTAGSLPAPRSRRQPGIGLLPTARFSVLVPARDGSPATPPIPISTSNCNFRRREDQQRSVYPFHKRGRTHKTGYEAQIWDYQPAGYNTGSLVDSLKAAPTKILDGQWNDYNIKAVGDHYVVVLDGKTILDDHDSKHTEGVIGLQCQPGNKDGVQTSSYSPLRGHFLVGMTGKYPE